MTDIGNPGASQSFMIIDDSDAAFDATGVVETRC